GAVVDGYCSDMTRTVALGEPDARLRSVYDVVREAQAAGVAALRDGVASDAVDAACRDLVTAAGYGDAFVHGTGHGIGLAVHEDPYLRPLRAPPGVTTGASATLRARMTVTVEPGVYLPGAGGVRIEDTLAVTATGAEVLTRTPKDLVVL
ncbi:MAG: M24 family metallopeptidase, partial [Actinomycetota bacterium]|nr:M24 family metallopeptidase [Actinomycetota bacterium]